jgi:hypothetical protein
VKIPVDFENKQKEGLVEKCELEKEIFMANSLTAVRNGYVLTSILNTNDQEIRIPEPRLKLARVEKMSIDTEGRVTE